jgi:membrane-associated protease RseP (regulator of RpoE activity)
MLLSLPFSLTVLNHSMIRFVWVWLFFVLFFISLLLAILAECQTVPLQEKKDELLNNEIRHY